MCHLSILAFIALLSAAPVQPGEIFDVTGNRVFCAKGTGAARKLELRDGRMGTYHEIRLVHEPLGRTFEWEARWDQVTGEGELVMDYVFSDRQWTWVEGTGVMSGKDQGDYP